MGLKSAEQDSSRLFLNCDLKSGELFSLVDDEYPSRVFGYKNQEIVSKEANDSYFIFCMSGEVELRQDLLCEVVIGTGMFASAPGPLRISGAGSALVIEFKNYKCLRSFGGPIEELGRLKYIDGCSTSLLHYPARLGDPCLNLLVFPPHTEQTPHTHPSYRIGVVFSGEGVCCIDNQKIPLSPGKCFVIPKNVRHCFHSFARPLQVIAFHPDSDWGPTDEVHPMLNRTIIQRQVEF